MVSVVGGQHQLLLLPLPCRCRRPPPPVPNSVIINSKLKPLCLPLFDSKPYSPFFRNSSTSLIQHTPLSPAPAAQGDENNNTNYDSSSGGNNNNNNNGKGRWGNPFDSSSSDEGGGGCCQKNSPLFLAILLLFVIPSIIATLLPLSAIALSDSNAGSGNSSSSSSGGGGVWEVRGGKWTRLSPPDGSRADSSSSSSKSKSNNGRSSGFLHPGLDSCWKQCRDLFLGLMLPEGFPNSVSSDYLQYSLWRGLQGIASQISGVLATQFLCFAGTGSSAAIAPPHPRDPGYPSMPCRIDAPASYKGI